VKIPEVIWCWRRVRNEDIRDWTHLAEDREKWKAPTNTAMNLQVPETI
jgi:hypothetical protein